MRGLNFTNATRQAMGDVEVAPREFMKHRPSIRQRTLPVFKGISNHMHDCSRSQSGSAVRGMATSTVNFRDKAPFSRFPPQEFVGVSATSRPSASALGLITPGTTRLLCLNGDRSRINCAQPE